MASRKHRGGHRPEPPAQDVVPVAPAREAANENQPKPAAPPAGPAKSPTRFMFLLWGIPLILFVVVAVVKQCGG